MRLINEFTVEAPVQRTWETLLDVARVAACLPGAAVEPVGEQGLYRGQLRMKVGPVNMAYSGTVRLLDVDADELVATFEARAKETRGTGTAAAQIRNRLTQVGNATRVEVQTDLDVTGRPAQFGRGLMQDVASKMLGDFSGRLEELVLSPPVAADAGARAASPVTPPGTGGEEPRQAPADIPSDADDPGELGQFDVGSVLLRGYGRQLAAAGALAALAGMLWRWRSRARGFEIIFRYRL